MAYRTIKSLTGGTRDVATEALDSFAIDLDGSLVYPEDEAFAATVHIWNALSKKQPAVAVHAVSTRDITRTIAFARDNGLEISVKGGGHNIAGLALSEGGITLDLSGMKDIEVDAETRLARVGPGCTAGDVDRATQEHGLATTLGFVSETGAAGLTLGGGFGYLSRRFGWTVDDLEEVEIVTADGVLRRASGTENEDLFWALRGGGGNFGVVTEFTFRLHDVGPEITAGMIAWPATEADRVLDLYRRVTDSAPRELTVAALMRNAPPAPWLPETAHGRPIIALLVCHSGSVDQAETDLASIRAHGEPLADIISVKNYVDQQSMLDALQPKGLHYYWKSEFLPGLDDGLLEAYKELLVDNVSPTNQLVLFHVAGAVNDHPEDDGSVGNRDAAHVCVIQAAWPEGTPAGDAYRSWVHRAWEALKPYSTGGNYVNFQTADEADDRTMASYRSNYQRLEAVKVKFDPSNLFRVNRNIQPPPPTPAST